MPKKSLGQHFLTDPSVIKWIVDKIPKSLDKLIEIGPGRGALTNHLSKESTIVFEMDDALVDHWKKEGFEVIRGDAVQTLSEYMPDIKNKFGENLVVVSNLPYNASTQIYVELMKLRVPKMILMFQKEVGQKIRADYGDRNFGRLSLLTKIFYEVENHKLVPPGAFYPPPKIFSEVLIFSLKKTPLLTPQKFSELEMAIKLLFQFPRKKIKAANVFLENISDKRPHELKEEEWLKILAEKVTFN